MNYQEVMNYLEKTWRFGSRLGLERVRELLRRLGDPQKQLRFIHVAGTNGKGSTTTYIAAILAESGLKVGVYTSPFILRFNDRVRILDGPDAVAARLEDGETGEITEDDIARIFTRVAETADDMTRDSLDSPTEFELITAMALIYFSEQACDVVVLEVGLGGRLDSTNVIDAAEVAVITALGYDHMDRLGNTIGEIAREKAGIIKAGCKQAILYDPRLATKTEAEALDARQAVEEHCAELAVPLTVVGDEWILPMEKTFVGQSFRLHGYARPLYTRLIGAYQPQNATVAIRAVEAFMPELSGSEAVYRGLRNARWPGRLEVVSDQPLFIIDGAHNPQAAWQLRHTLEQLAVGRKLVMLTGILADKEYKPMLEELLLDTPYITEAIFVTEPLIFRKKAAADYLEGIEAFYNEHPEETQPALHMETAVGQALKDALDCAGKENRILLAWGSLYLATDIKLAYAKITRELLSEKGETR